MIGKTEHLPNLKDKSKYEIDKLYEKIKYDDALTSFHYFTLAKLIEHYTETNNYQKIEYVIALLNPFLEKSLNDKRILNLGEAIDKTIFHRDVFRALKMIDSSKAGIHLRNAIDIAYQYNIKNQEEKIRQIESMWENRRIHNGIISVFEFAKLRCSHFNTTKPYLLISYGHANAGVVNRDFNELVKMYNCWIDFENLDGVRNENYDNWTQKVKPVIENDLCRGILLYCSKESIECSRGALLEAEWISKHKKDFFVFLIGFDDMLSSDYSSFLINDVHCLNNDGHENYDLHLRIINAYSNILQVGTDKDEISVYHTKDDMSHLHISDFTNWADKTLNNI